MKKKEYVQFSVDNPFQYHMTGKFVAPSESWIHQEAPLDDFELFIVTDDVLYIEHGGTQYTVENGEFLLLPPLTGPDSHRKGFRPSRCSFYWLHFLPANPYTLYQDTPPCGHFFQKQHLHPAFRTDSECEQAGRTDAPAPEQPAAGLRRCFPEL